MIPPSVLPSGRCILILAVRSIQGFQLCIIICIMYSRERYKNYISFVEYIQKIKKIPRYVYKHIYEFVFIFYIYHILTHIYIYT
jgi:hypothetical protein